VVAIGSIVGALYTSRQHRSTLRTLLTQGATLALCYLLAAAAPERVSFFLALFAVGIATLVFLTGTNAMVQVSTPSSHLGRVTGLYVLTILGSASIGGPLLGLVDQHAGPRFGLLLAGLVPGATVAAMTWLIIRRRRRLEPTSKASSASRNRASSVDSFAHMVAAQGVHRATDRMFRGPDEGDHLRAS
jgi:MFS family permease